MYRVSSRQIRKSIAFRTGNPFKTIGSRPTFHPTKKLTLCRHKEALKEFKTLFLSSSPQVTEKGANPNE